MKSLKPAWRNWVLEVTVAVFLLGISIAAPFFAPLGVLFLLVPVYYRISRRYQVSPQKIESTVGLVARRIDTIRLEDLRNVNMKQGIFQRIMNTGDLEFSSSGGGGIEVVFKGVSRPKRLKDYVENLQGGNVN